MKAEVRYKVLTQALRALAREFGWLTFFRALRDVAGMESAKTAHTVAEQAVAEFERHPLTDNLNSEPHHEPAGGVPPIQ